MVNYIHDLCGGFDNNKRREVRKLFAVTGECGFDYKDEEASEENLHIIVGILFEFKQIGIKRFTASHVTDAVAIFKLSDRFSSFTSVRNGVYNLLKHPKVRLINDNSFYDVPDDNRLQHLSQQFCQKVTA